MEAATEVLAEVPANGNGVESGDIPPKRDEAVFDFPNPSGKAWKQQEQDKPPAKRRGRPPGSSKAASKAKIRKAVSQFYLGAGMLTMRFVDNYDGKVILHNGEALTNETMKLAEEYPWVMSTLETWTSVSAIGGFVAVLCNVAVPIMVNHEALPEIALGFVDAPEFEEEGED